MILLKAISLGLFSLIGTFCLCALLSGFIRLLSPSSLPVREDPRIELAYKLSVFISHTVGFLVVLRCLS